MPAPSRSCAAQFLLVIAGLDPAIPRRCLDHRVTALRAGPAMTDKGRMSVRVGVTAFILDL
jgi:hypothetical protein